MSEKFSSGTINSKQSFRTSAYTSFSFCFLLCLNTTFFFLKIYKVYPYTFYYNIGADLKDVRSCNLRTFLDRSTISKILHLISFPLVHLGFTNAIQTTDPKPYYYTTCTLRFVSWTVLYASCMVPFVFWTVRNVSCTVCFVFCTERFVILRHDLLNGIQISRRSLLGFCFIVHFIKCVFFLTESTVPCVCIY